MVNVKKQARGKSTKAEGTEPLYMTNKKGKDAKRAVKISECNHELKKYFF